MTSASKSDRQIVCGVVEGFYGRPWTFNQRTELFERMHSWQMNTYLYAPKDDLKHRQMWRDLYIPDEATQLRMLIGSANSNEIMFVYAISPGLDITFSNEKDVDSLKVKMKQVMDFGCHAFALLFDDIDPNLNAIDKAKFDSLASAQVFVTNELFDFLNKPRFFLFCPTEYCATRAMPSVSYSEYLNTIGANLLPNIDIMWTGPKVISKSIAVESIEELSKVLRRAPVIWDNIHANDYDQKRLFLGPYCGRSNKLLPKLRGVLTNPNCEFEANFIAVYTLAQWFKHNIIPSVNNDRCYDAIDCLDAALSCWMKHLYKATSPSVDNDMGLQSKKSVAQALMATAVGSLPLSTASIAVAATQVLSHEVCTAAVAAVAQQNPSAAADFVSESLMDAQNLPSNVGSANDWTTIGNAMVDNDKDVAATAFAVASVVTQAAEKEAAEICESETIQEVLHKEMMHSILDQEKNNYCENKDCVIVQDMLSRRASKQESDINQMNFDIMAQEPMECSYHTDHDKIDSQVNVDVLSMEHLRLLVDLYYLPYEHGFRAVNMLELVHWLRSHAHLVDRNDVDDEQHDNGAFCIDNVQETSPDHDNVSSCEHSNISTVKLSHWREKAAQFHQNVERVRELTNLFCSIPNKSVLSDLYSYLQDARHVLEALDSYIKWLERAKIPYSSVCALRRLLSWCTPGYKEMFTGDDYESWMFRGGLIAEFQRMFPVDNAYDLFPIRASFIQYSPDFSVSGILSDVSDIESNPHNGCHNFNKPKPNNIKSTVFNVRPYQSQDRTSVYALCLQLVNSRASLALHDYKSYSEDILDLPADRYIGAFLDFCPTHCLVVESDESVIVGYGFGCINATEFEVYRSKEYYPKMQVKYSKYLSSNSNSDSEMTDSIDSDPNASDKDTSAIQKMLNYFLGENSNLPHSDHSVVMYFDIKECCKPIDLDSIDSLSRRLLICLFSALKTSTAEVTEPTTIQGYPASIINSGTVTTSSIAVVSQTSIITTSVPLVTMTPVLQVTSKDRGPIMSLTVFAEVDSLNKIHKEFYKRYGFSEMTLPIGSDNIILTRII